MVSGEPVALKNRGIAPSDEPLGPDARETSTSGAKLTRLHCEAGAPLQPANAWRPAEIIALAFVLLNLVCLGIGFQHVPSAGWVLLGFASYLAWLLALRYLPLERRAVPKHFAPIAHFLREAHVLLMIGPAYVASGFVNRAIFQHYFDDQVSSWDRALFHGNPNAYLAQLWPWAWLSEFLHLSYYVYLWLVPALGLTLYFLRRYGAFRVAATCIALTYAVCNVVFLLFPVQGPYYTFPRIDAPGRVFVDLVHWTLERGAAMGTAFPSSHCAAAVVVTLMAFRFLPRLAPVFAVVACGIVLGTVYGGFHYAIDAAVGVLIGLLAGIFGPRCHSWLEATFSRGSCR